MSARRPVAALLCGLALLAVPVHAGASERYVPYSGIETGTDGVIAVPLVIENAGPAAIGCTAELAHWYSLPLGRAAPGATVEAVLWHAPDGTLALLNAGQDRMPVEAITCGPDATPHAAKLALPFTAGIAPEGLRRQCAPRGGKWACTAVE